MSFGDYNLRGLHVDCCAALRRPYTFVVVALLLLILGPIVIFRTPTDIFPNINILWSAFSGTTPD